MSFLGLRVKVLIRLFLMLVLTMDFSLCCRARRKPAWATKAAQACGIRVHRGARVASQQSPILRMDQMFVRSFILSCKWDLVSRANSFARPFFAAVARARLPVWRRGLSRFARPGLPACPWV